jgi:hypothetical protein
VGGVRARERERIAALARELAAEVDATLARSMSLVWARDIPDRWASAHVIGGVYEILVCETHWRDSDSEERADTIAHEVAHVVCWWRGVEEPLHGRKWRACFRRLRAIAVEMEW